MKSIIFLTIILSNTYLFGQTMESITVEQRLAEIEDKMAIKEVVDKFSNLADTKEIDQQVLLFTEDGEVESVTNGQGNVLKGREQLKQVFSGFLSNFDVVYHQNGQQTIEILTETTANAISYCRVILIGNQNDQQVKTTLYAIYNDEFVKQNGQWLIKKRKSNFVWREVEEI
jgi:hypothetical protein